MFVVSHYRVLGVPSGATRVQIRAAYVQAARSAHPDLQRRVVGPARRRAADRMCALNEAWRVLGDSSRRRIYDAHRIATAAGVRGATAPTGPTVSTSRASNEPRPERVPGRAPPGGHGNPLVLLPAGLFGLALVQFVAGLLIGVPAILATGAVTFAVSIAAFAAAPLLMVATTRSDRRPAAG